MKRYSLVAIAIWSIAGVCNGGGSDTKQADIGECPLTPKCGPWMVMVKSFRGPEAIETANKLVRELREKHKINAYTFIKPLDPSQAQPVQQVGMVRGRVRQFETAAVLAGDCPNERAAGKLQDKIHSIRPDCITQEMVPVYQWKVGALRTAFCLPNPLAPAEPPKPDPQIAKWNSGKNSIFHCPGPYTLQAYVFTGGVAFTRPQEKQMEKSNMLELASERAETLADQLQKDGNQAYTYHALNYSMVAVGSFASPQDPQIEEVRKRIAGKKFGSFALTANPQVVQVPR